MSESKDRSVLLRRALRGNAAFSGLSGLVCLLAADSVAAYLGLAEPGLVRSNGPGLLAFAAWLLWIASRPVPPLGQVLAVVALDLAWVAGSVWLLLGQPVALSAPGRWVVGLVALAVLTLADLQAWGIVRLRRAS